MLSVRIGDHRVAAEPEAVDEVATLCAHLPLALAVAAARAAARPRFPLTELAAELGDAVGRLDALDAGEPASSVRAVFSWSYRQLGAGAARLFRLLGLHPGQDISVRAAASLAAVDEAHAAYAAAKARECDPEADRDAASGRILDHYLHTVSHSSMLLQPSREPLALAPPRPGTRPERPADHRQARAWFEAEHQVLLAAVTYAAEIGADRHAWQLPCAMKVFLHQRRDPQQRVTVMSGAVAAAGRLGDAVGQATSLRYLANAYTHTGDYGQAKTHLERCLLLYQRVADPMGEAWAQHNLALLAEAQGRYADALGHDERALGLFRAIGHETGEAEMLNDLGWFHALLGDYQRARRFAEQSLAPVTKLGGGPTEYNVWDILGYIDYHLGNFAQAAEHFAVALGLCRDQGNRFAEAVVLVHAGDARRAAGEPAQARQAWQQALAIYDDIQHPHARKVRAKLASTED